MSDDNYKNELLKMMDSDQRRAFIQKDIAISEEKERQETLKRKRMEPGRLKRIFRRNQERVTEPEQGNCSLEYFLCQGKWSGNNEEKLVQHLEKGHNVVFKIKELIELSENHPEDLEPAADDKSEGEAERLLTAKKSADTTPG